MKIFNFSKPKQSIINILFIVGLLSLFIFILALGTAVSWKYYPEYISKVDVKFPNFYGKKIKGLELNTLKAKSEEDKYLAYLKLYDELKDISAMNNYYYLKQNASKYLISYYINKKEINKAEKLAKEWEVNYPYDFIAKFEYIKVLSIISESKTLDYYSSFYKIYKDVKEVKDGYITYLLKQEKYNLALNIYANDHKNDREILDQSEKAIRFQLFYMDDMNKFSQKQSIKSFQYKKNKNSYTVDFFKLFENLNGLRLDIDQLSKGTKISNISFALQGVKLQDNLSILKMNNLIKLEENKYEVNGLDPYIVLSLKENFKNYSGELKIIATMEIDSINPKISNILTNKEWKIFIDSGKGFNEKESELFELSIKDDNYIIQKNVQSSTTRKIRIDFPSLIGLKVDDFELIINENDIYSKKNISKSNSIKIHKTNIEIISEDPYVVINFEQVKSISHVKIKFKFTGDKNE